jgi:hypothetical protein
MSEVWCRILAAGVLVAGLAENLVMEELKGLQCVCVAGAFMYYLLVCKFSLRQK